MSDIGLIRDVATTSMDSDKAIVGLCESIVANISEVRVQLLKQQAQLLEYGKLLQTLTDIVATHIRSTEEKH